MEKIISIIIATYNAEKTLKRCLDSIVAQKNDVVEVLIIDGCSNDQTIEVVKEYGEAIDYYISERDNGIYDAWNKGVKKATGKWVLFVGSDDYLAENAIKHYLTFIEEYTSYAYDIISGKCQYIDENGSPLSVIGEAYRYKKFTRYMNISHGTTLHNANLFKEIGCYNLKYKICADYELLLRRSLKSGYIDQILLYMQRGGMSYSFKGIIETYRIKKEKQILPFAINALYLIRGCIGLGCRMLCYKICSKK